MLFNTKKKLTDYYYIERIFDRRTYRLAHREQWEEDGLGGEAKKEKNLRSGHIVQIRGKHALGKKLERGAYAL